MSLARLAGFEILSLRIDMPLQGAWTATAELDVGNDAAPAGSIEIVFDTDPAVTFKGTIVPPSAGSSPVPGRARVFLRAGKAGMGTLLAGLPYANVAPLLVVQDIVSSGGETLGSTGALSALSRRLLWLRAAGPAGSALTRFLSPAGLSWRMTPAGVVDVVQEAWPAYPGTPLLERDPDELGRCTVALDAPDLYPGVTLFGRHVTRVVHCIRLDGKFRTEAVLQ